MQSFLRHNFQMETNLDITLRLNIKTNSFIKYQFQYYMLGKKSLACYIIPFNRGLGLDN